MVSYPHHLASPDKICLKLLWELSACLYVIISSWWSGVLRAAYNEVYLRHSCRRTGMNEQCKVISKLLLISHPTRIGGWVCLNLKWLRNFDQCWLHCTVCALRCRSSCKLLCYPYLCNWNGHRSSLLCSGSGWQKPGRSGGAGLGRQQSTSGSADWPVYDTCQASRLPTLYLWTHWPLSLKGKILFKIRVAVASMPLCNYFILLIWGLFRSAYSEVYLRHSCRRAGIKE